jgi:DNA repair ATPase RecN
MEAKLAAETSLKDYNSTVKKLQTLRNEFKGDIENLLAKYRELRGSSELSDIKEYDAHVRIMEMALNKYRNGDPNLDTPLSQEEPSTPVSAEVKATMLEACVLHRLVMRGHNFGVVFEDTGDITTQHGAYVKRLVHYMESKKVGDLMKNLKVDVSGGPVKGDPIGLVRLAALAGLEKTKK